MRDKAGIRSQIRKKIERLPLSAFSAPYLLVCEAISEAWFFFRLFENRNIVNFIIDYPLIEGEGEKAALFPPAPQLLENICVDLRQKFNSTQEYSRQLF